MTQDLIYCFPKGQPTPIGDCIDDCGTPEQRPFCWAARGIAHSFDAADSVEGEREWLARHDSAAVEGSGRSDERA